MKKTLVVLSVLIVVLVAYKVIFKVSPYSYFVSTIEIGEIPEVISTQDKDRDGIDDFTDIVESAKKQIGIVTKYDTSYYGDGGFPPNNSGACADIIWRTFNGAGYDIKTLLENDIKEHPERYDERFLSDSNINFRRTENLRAFLQANTKELTNEIILGDIENLSKWQGGDIVTFEQIPGGLWHIGIISDNRRPDGVPLLIHNHGYGVLENDYLTNWPTKVSGHFRFEFND